MRCCYGILLTAWVPHLEQTCQSTVSAVVQETVVLSATDSHIQSEKILQCRQAV
jgi:hypothetical protein